MTPQNYLQNELAKLKTPFSCGDQIDFEERIIKLVLSKKFRKYSANEALIQHIKDVIHYCVGWHEPINFIFTWCL